jgi:hypothetical protein
LKSVSLSFFSLGCLLLGCTQVSNTIGDKIQSGSELFPSSVKGGPVTLVLGGIDIPAITQISSNDSTREIRVIANSEEIESEVYKVTEQEIALSHIGIGKALGGETYNPPLTLVKFPMSVDGKVEWRGKLLIGDREFDASAVTVSKREQISLPTGTLETLHLQATLKISDGASMVSERKFEFWFGMGLGPVKRDFGNQVRIPRKPVDETGD